MLGDTREKNGLWEPWVSRLESNAEETGHFPSISDGVGLSSSWVCSLPTWGLVQSLLARALGHQQTLLQRHSPSTAQGIHAGMCSGLRKSRVVFSQGPPEHSLSWGESPFSVLLKHIQQKKRFLLGWFVIIQCSIHNPAIPLLDRYQRKWNQDFHYHVPCRIIYNSLDRDTTAQARYTLMDEWVKKLPCVYGIQLSKRTKYKNCIYISQLGGYCAKWSKPDPKRQILHDLTCMWNLEE